VQVPAAVLEPLIADDDGMPRYGRGWTSETHAAPQSGQGFQSAQCVSRLRRMRRSTFIIIRIYYDILLVLLAEICQFMPIKSMYLQARVVLVPKFPWDMGGKVVLVTGGN
jgi:hypothetical protein